MYHGNLTINDVYIRKTRNGMDCKKCSQECAIRRRLANPDVFKERGRKYRKIQLHADITQRKCSACQQELPLNHFSIYAQTLRHPYCKPCMSIANKNNKIKNKDTYEAYRARASQLSRKSYLKNNWNMTTDDFNKMLATQENRCAICGNSPKVLHIDHDHNTGKIRELLCNNCNRGIGHLKESESILISAISYIKKHQPTQLV